MVLDAVANFVRGRTSGGVDSTQTTIPVEDASIFPDPSTENEYNVVAWYAVDYPRPDQDPDVEILRVTAIDTDEDELTVDRGQEGTSGASHPSLTALQLSPTAKMFSDIENRNVEGLETEGSDTTVPVSQGDGTLEMENIDYSDVDNPPSDTNATGGGVSTKDIDANNVDVPDGDTTTTTHDLGSYVMVVKLEITVEAEATSEAWADLEGYSETINAGNGTDDNDTINFTYTDEGFVADTVEIEYEDRQGGGQTMDMNGTVWYYDVTDHSHSI